jgi:hypothetical protein
VQNQIEKAPPLHPCPSTSFKEASEGTKEKLPLTRTVLQSVRYVYVTSQLRVVEVGLCETIFEAKSQKGRQSTQIYSIRLD